MEYKIHLTQGDDGMWNAKVIGWKFGPAKNVRELPGPALVHAWTVAKHVQLVTTISGEEIGPIMTQVAGLITAYENSAMATSLLN